MLIKLAVSTTAVFGLILIRKFKDYIWGKSKKSVNVKEKTVIITGANSRLGKATALELAQRGARVILACGDQEKGQKALVDIRSKSSSGVLKVMELDLASFDSIRKFADEFMQSEDRLDILINNASVFQDTYMTTKEGYEMHFGVNHLGHFLLTKLLFEKLKQSSPSRIVMVSSALYKRGTINHNTNFDTIIHPEEHYDKSLAYNNSKWANVLFTRELDKRLFLEDTGVSVYAVCPGMVWTNWYMSLNWWKFAAFAPLAGFFIRTPRQGAQAILHCAIGEEAELESGGFYSNCKREDYSDQVPFIDACRQLWEFSEALCGPFNVKSTKKKEVSESSRIRRQIKNNRQGKATNLVLATRFEIDGR